MCLRLKKNRPNLNPSVAKKDIVVYKILNETYDGNYESPFRSGTKWIKKGTKTSEFQILPSLWFTGWEIHRGLHSWQTFTAAKELAKNIGYNTSIIAKMYIPKGTEYYVGDNDDLVSKKLVWNGEIISKYNSKLK